MFPRNVQTTLRGVATSMRRPEGHLGFEPEHSADGGHKSRLHLVPLRQFAGQTAVHQLRTYPHPACANPQVSGPYDLPASRKTNIHEKPDNMLTEICVPLFALIFSNLALALSPHFFPHHKLVSTPQNFTSALSVFRLPTVWTSLD